MGAMCHAYIGTPTNYQPQKKTGLCACPSAWPLKHHGPRGKSPSSSSSPPLSLPGWCQCLWQPQRDLRHLRCLARPPHPVEEWWPSLSPTLELNTTLIKSIWSCTALRWSLMKPLTTCSLQGRTGLCSHWYKHHPCQMTYSAKSNQFKSHQIWGHYKLDKTPQ